MNLVKEKNKKNVFLKIFKTQLDIKDIYKDLTFKLTFFLYFNSAERKRGDILNENKRRCREFQTSHGAAAGPAQHDDTHLHPLLLRSICGIFTKNGVISGLLFIEYRCTKYWMFGLF